VVPGVGDMYSSKIEFLDNGQVSRYSLFRDHVPLSYADAIALWQADRRFREIFVEILRDAPFPAYFWETPPITANSVTRPFEFVLVDSPALVAMRADSDAFAAHFNTTDKDQVVTFSNLANDAVLITPRPGAHGSAYPHLAAFSRDAPRRQQDQLWCRVGRVVLQRLQQRPLWVSTSGLGVPWLHVRVDTFPKYYTYAPYRVASGRGR